MSYLETLNSHNTQIQNLINKANSLPEAGGSGGTGGAELCTVTITMIDMPPAGDELFYYIDGSSEIKILSGDSLSMGNSASINVMKNSFICTNVFFGNKEPDISIGDGPFIRLYFITEDVNLNITM